MIIQECLQQEVSLQKVSNTLSVQAGTPTVSLALVDWHLLLTHHVNLSGWGNQGKYDEIVTRKN